MIPRKKASVKSSNSVIFFLIRYLMRIGYLMRRGLFL